MAKGGRRRPSRNKKIYRKDTGNKEAKRSQSVKSRKKQARKSESLVRQMRGKKWDEEEYSEEVEELDDVK